MIPEQKADERAKQPEGSTVREWHYEIQYGPNGESGYAWVYVGSDMVGTVKVHHAIAICNAMEVAHRRYPALADTNGALMDEVARLKAINAILMGDDEDKPRYTTKRLRHEIAQATSTLTARIEALHLMQELGEDLAWRSYLGIQVLQTVLKKSKLEAGADVSAKLLTDIAIQYPHFLAKSALRPMPTRRELENNK